MNKVNSNKERLKIAGNYTRNAIKNFENNIVHRHNFLEEVESKLKNKTH